MRKVSIALAGAAIAAMVAGTSALADGHLEKAIDARNAQMTLYSWNLGMLGGMAKGTVEYDAAKASAAASNLAALSAMSSQGLWPEGSDSTAMAGKTRALPEIWSTYPAVAEKGAALKEAAAKLAQVAGNGLDALKGGVGDVGKACGDCHKQFRMPK
ncbi:MAG: cytochrome c [Nisaea sp.]|uniref:c-type cytochrome n=1 Tax=Nisaea sp. TaxID=2024842 RepID=UPI001B298993|nr:cytochrome c [Nisaea sp.]MBO6562916.1 cytochrome c [Nisaea sp.]